MLQVYCDACKKNVPAPRCGTNFVSIFDKDLCVSCAKKLENSIEDLMEKEKGYHLKNYARNQRLILTRMTK